MTQDNNTLNVEKLTKDFGGLRALDSLSLVVKEGQIHGLIGPNGSGKTTFFNVMTGLLPTTGGKVYFESKDITNFEPYVIANMGISRTFQAGKLALNMTVLENVMTGSYTRTKLDIFGTLLRRPGTSSAQEENIRRKSMDLLELVGLSGSAERWAKELVWVERQLVQIARAISAEPKLLLLDEPTSGMGAQESMRVESIIRQVRNKLGISVIVICHDVRLVTGISDWITAINFGKKIAEGPPDQVQNNEQVLEAYLGKE